MREVSRADYRHCAGAVCGVRADGVSLRGHRPVLQTVRGDHRHLDGDPAINSLTLSPALAALLLKPHGAKKDLPTRLIDRLFGWIFRPFNRFFLRSSNGYQGLVGKTLGRRGAVFAVYLLLLCAAGVMFKVVPGGFIPTQISCISLAA